MTTLETALAVHQMTLPIVIIPPGQKGPRERAWQNIRFTADEIEQRFASNPDLNVGVVLGTVLDIEGDDENSDADYAELFESCEQPPTTTWRSKRSTHRLYLADARLTALGKAVVKYKSLEIRLGAGRAAQSLLPPSTTDGFTREWVVPLCNPAKLPDKVVDRILSAALPKSVQEKLAAPLDKSKPGDDFCGRVKWTEVLEPHGWASAGETDDVQYWRRPGKDDGLSATTGHCTSASGRDLLYVFSDNAQPFERGKTYSKFAAYTVLNHGSDFRAAAAALAEKGYGTKKRPTASAGLLRVVSSAELFHTPAGEAYITIPVANRMETHSVHSTYFKQFLEHQHFLKNQTAPPSKALGEALGVIAARARFEGQERSVFTRLAGHDGSIYLDLANDEWQVVEITAGGWKIVTRPPVKFRRPAGMRPLPRPELGGTSDELRKFVNVDNDSFTLLVAALVAALRPAGPYPIMLINSEHGSCKSTSMRVCRELIDPNVAPIRSTPGSVEALMLAANNGWLLGFDNASGFSPWLADAFCRLSTGGGLGVRALYTNFEEALFDAQRPLMVTGIGDLTTREDFLDRCVVIHCPVMPEEKRLGEDEFKEAFEKARPRILGALLTGTSAAIRCLPSARETLKGRPRMADFALWATAAEAGFGWAPGTFMQAYGRNREQANEIVLDNPICDAIRKLLDPANAGNDGVSVKGNRVVWSGTAEPLLKVLRNERCGSNSKQGSNDLPGSGAALTSKLNRMVVNLRQAGITAEHHRRTWTLSAEIAA